MLSNIFRGAIFQNSAERRANRYRELIRKEAKIGGELFGPISANGRREFFCLDRHTWVWHEEWVDAAGKHRAVTTRYDVRPNAVFKAQDGQPYTPLAGDEARYFLKAVEIYNQRVQTELYSALA